MDRWPSADSTEMLDPGCPGRLGPDADHVEANLTVHLGVAGQPLRREGPQPTDLGRTHCLGRHPESFAAPGLHFLEA